VDKLEKYFCPLCKKKYNDFHKLRRHVFRSHNLEKVNCPYCGKQFENFREFVKHSRMRKEEKHQNFYFLLTPQYNTHVKKEMFLTTIENLECG